MVALAFNDQPWLDNHITQDERTFQLEVHAGTVGYYVGSSVGLNHLCALRRAVHARGGLQTMRNPTVAAAIQMYDHSSRM